MHELSIAGTILETVEAEAARRPAMRVIKVGVRVGELSGVNAEALQFGFEALVKGTHLDPLALEIEQVPLRHRCSICAHLFSAQDEVSRCPLCASPDILLVGGDDLHLAYLEVEDR